MQSVQLQMQRQLLSTQCRNDICRHFEKKDGNEDMEEDDDEDVVEDDEDDADV